MIAALAKHVLTDNVNQVAIKMLVNNAMEQAVVKAPVIFYANNVMVVEGA